MAHETNDRDGLIARRRRLMRRLEDFRWERGCGSKMSPVRRKLRDAVARIDQKLRRLKNGHAKS